jgi:hypothetical protein
MTIPLRFLIMFGSILLGFVFPLTFIIAAVLGWTIIRDITGQTDSEEAHTNQVSGKIVRKSENGPESPKITADPEPISITSTLRSISEFSETMHAKASRLYDESVIDLALSMPLSAVEFLVTNASKSTLLASMTERLSGDDEELRVDREFRKNIKEIWESTADIIARTSDMTENLPKIRMAVSREHGRAYCETRIHEVTDQHLEKIYSAHSLIFPQIPAFSEGADPRDDIIRQLRSIFFQGADPKKFQHPYVPPTRRNVIFRIWWINNVARSKSA